MEEILHELRFIVYPSDAGFLKKINSMYKQNKGCVQNSDAKQMTFKIAWNLGTGSTGATC